MQKALYTISAEVLIVLVSFLIKPELVADNLALMAVVGVLSLLLAIVWDTSVFSSLISRRDVSWASGKTRFQIWEASAFITDTPLNDYSNSMQSQALCTEIIYYVEQYLINLAGEAQPPMFNRVFPRPNITKLSYLSVNTVMKIKESGLSEWLPLADEINNESRQ